MPDILPTGTCFEDTTWFFIQEGIKYKRNQDPMWLLVHGICHHEDGRPYSHAWIEHLDKVWFSGIVDGETVFLKASQSEFYREFKVTETTKYTWTQAVEADRCNRGMPPPWEPKYRRLCKDYKEGK